MLRRNLKVASAPTLWLVVHGSAFHGVHDEEPKDAFMFATEFYAMFFNRRFWGFGFSRSLHVDRKPQFSRLQQVQRSFFCGTYVQIVTI